LSLRIVIELPTDISFKMHRVRVCRISTRASGRVGPASTPPKSGWYREIAPVPGDDLLQWQSNLREKNEGGKGTLMMKWDVIEDNNSAPKGEEAIGENHMGQLQAYWRVREKQLKEEYEQKSWRARLQTLRESRNPLRLIQRFIRRKLWPDLVAEEHQLSNEIEAYEAVLSTVQRSDPSAAWQYTGATWELAPTRCQYVQMTGHPHINCENPFHNPGRREPNYKILTYIAVANVILVLIPYTRYLLHHAITFSVEGLSSFLFDWRLMPVYPYTGFFQFQFLVNLFLDIISFTVGFPDWQVVINKVIELIPKVVLFLRCGPEGATINCR
jgi:hypothetical protein